MHLLRKCSKSSLFSILFSLKKDKERYTRKIRKNFSLSFFSVVKSYKFHKKVYNCIERKHLNMSDSGLNELTNILNVYDFLKNNVKFYGKVANFSDKVFDLKFERAEVDYSEGSIRLYFNIPSLGSIFYTLEQYGKLFSISKEDLDKTCVKE